MCLIVFDWQPNSERILRLVANRDEFHARPSAPLAAWADIPEIVGGRDLEAGGSWLAISTRERLAAITNVREPGITVDHPLSRGALVREFLRRKDSVEDYLSEIQSEAHRYPGFNLLLLAQKTLWYYSNRGDRAKQLNPGIYGLSNAGLDTPWPKLLDAKSHLAKHIHDFDLRSGLDILSRREPYPDTDLPDTGVDATVERMLSPAFISSPQYGTRCTTALEWTSSHANMIERRYDAAGDNCGETTLQVKFN